MKIIIKCVYIIYKILNFFSVRLLETVKGLCKQWLSFYNMPERTQGKKETNDLV